MSKDFSDQKYYTITWTDDSTITLGVLPTEDANHAVDFAKKLHELDYGVVPRLKYIRKLAK